MPELPEVEYAARRLREAVLGHTIARVRVHHASQRRGLPEAAQRATEGLTIDRVERRAKIQLLHLGNGAVLEVHFRMTGDWEFSPLAADPPRHERVSFDTTAGVRVSLVDSRAFSVVRLHPPGTFVLPPLGPEPLEEAFTPTVLRQALARRRGAIKSVLLDQHVVAGVGNIYAAEALWEARIHPAAVANTLSVARVTRLRDAIQLVLRTAPTGRYYAREFAEAAHAVIDEREIWRVYGREGCACRRCGFRVARIVQGARSTFYCSRCQRV